VSLARDGRCQGRGTGPGSADREAASGVTISVARRLPRRLEAAASGWSGLGLGQPACARLNRAPPLEPDGFTRAHARQWRRSV